MSASRLLLSTVLILLLTVSHQQCINKLNVQIPNTPATQVIVRSMFMQNLATNIRSIADAFYSVPTTNFTISQPTPAVVKDATSCITQDQCARKNGTASYTTINNTIVYYCFVCGLNQYWNLTNCTCRAGYSRGADNVCLKNPTPVIYRPTCTPPAQMVNTTCVCPTGLVYTETRVCIQNPCKDPQSSYVLSKGCVCKNTTLHLIDGFCRTCPTDQVWVQAQQRCRCKPGLVTLANNNCLACSTNAVLNSSRSGCVCKSGYVGNGTSCRKIA